MIGPEVLLATTLYLSDGVFVERTPQLRIAQTGSSETPLPSDIAPAVLMDLGTQPRGLPMDTGDLVQSAHRYMTAMAVIPIDADVDREVEDLVRRHEPARGKRPLRRKP